MGNDIESEATAEARKKSEALLEHASAQFQTSSLPTFIEYLNVQMNDTNAYSLANNVAILKIYLLYPSQLDVLVVQKILIQGLMQLPASDFTVYIAQIPLQIQSKEPISKIINLHSLLQSCSFHRFWDVAKVSTDYQTDLSVLDIPGLKDSVRRFILDILPLVYLQLTLSELRNLLNYESNCEEFENILTSCGWTLGLNYNRNDNTSEIYIQTPREELAKPAKGVSRSKVEKYLRSDTMQYYLSTLHN